MLQAIEPANITLTYRPALHTARVAKATVTSTENRLNAVAACSPGARSLPSNGPRPLFSGLFSGTRELVPARNPVGGGRREILPPITRAELELCRALKTRSGGGVASKHQAAAERASRYALLSLVPRLVSVAGGEGCGYFAENENKTVAAGSPAEFFSGWRRLFEPFSSAVRVGTDFETVVEIRATHPSGSAGASPAGISSAVVSRTRTPDLYARIDCSPVQDLLPTSLLDPTEINWP